MGKAVEPLVSVLMSVYNGEEWLDKAINSVLNQSYTNWEFIIVDDASTDNTKSLLAKYEANTKFKIIYSTNNAGCVKSFNIGLDKCHGIYIARFDADDLCEKDRFKKQVEYLEAFPDISMVASYINFIDQNDKSTGIWKDDRKYNNCKKIKKSLPYTNSIAHPSVMIKTSVLKEYRYNEKQINCEDWDLWLRLAADGKKIEKLQEPLLLYRMHNNSITANSFRRSAFWKKHIGYVIYLRTVFTEKKINWFNIKVMFAFCLNYIKLNLSLLKRFVLPS